MKTIPMELFDCTEIGKGILALTDKKEKVSGSNVGIIDFGNFILFWDTFLNIEATEEAIELSKNTFGDKPVMIVYSHSHLDHFLGTAAFNGSVQIISTTTVGKIMEDLRPKLPTWKKTPQQLAEIEATVVKEEGIERLNDLNTMLMMTNISRARSVVIPPTILFNDTLMIRGDDRTAQLKSFTTAHSEEDIVMVLENEKIVFTGDILMVKEHPWLGSGNPYNLKEALASLLDHKTFVPGHGSVGHRQDVADQIEYIDIIIDFMTRKKTEPDATLTLSDLPDKFKKWNPLCFQWNLDKVKI